MPRKGAAKATGIWEKEPGSNVWWIRYRVDGVLKREKVGRKSDALALYQKRKTQLRAGLKMPENMRSASVRFRMIAEDILAFSDKHHRDKRNVVGRLNRILADFGNRSADQIKPAQIDQWIADNTRTAATANRYRSLFSLVFREALRNGKVTSNPARLVRQRTENNARIRFLSDEEDARLRRVVLELYPKHLPELLISLGTGMRLSEQFTLTWRNVDMERREINLDHTKNGSPRTIPMNAVVFSALLHLNRDSISTPETSLVFSIRNPRKWFMAALKNAEIVHYRWHDNRHTFCSRLAMRGENLKVIQQLAGHKTIQMSARYAHLGEKSLRSAVEGLC